MNILIVESDAQLMLMLEKIVKLEGDSAITAKGCKDAAKAIAKKKLDMAIIDLDQSPAKKIDFVRALRESDPEKRIYIIMGTSEAEVSDILDVLEAGANEFITKPYERAIIEAKILFGKRRGYSDDAIGVLTEEHKAIMRAVRVLSYIADKQKTKEIPRTLLEWATSTSFLLDSEIHHRKEEHLIVAFIEAASKFQGQSSDSDLFSESSLKVIDNEHKDLLVLKKEIQVNISKLSQFPTDESRIELRGSIMDYINLLKDHMHREERLLFPTARPLLNEAENARLLKEFQEIEVAVGLEKIDAAVKVLLSAENLVQKQKERKKTPVE